MAKVLSRTVSIYVDGKQVDSTLNSLKAQYDQLKAKQKSLVIGTEEYIETSMKMREINDVLRETKNAMQEQTTVLENSLEKLSNVADIIEGLKSLSDFGGAVIGSLKDLVYAAAEMDDVYSDVMKTTGLTREQVHQLNEEFKKFDTRTSREELNQLAYEAGKLGINTKDAVAQFVSASDKINVALGDVLGDGAMVTIGKLADVYAKSTQQLADAGDNLEKKMLAIGSAVNQLGQESTANEGYLVEFLSRMGGIATQANLSADAILGFASALDQDMMKQEMSATAFQKFIMQLIKAPADFAKAAGMEVEKFTNLVRTDMNEALLAVLKGFQGSGGLVELQPIFEDLGLDAARAASVISSMANSIDQIRAAQASANEQLSSGNSILSEFATKNENMQAQADKAKKAFEDMRLELGEKLYPVVIHLTRASTIGLKSLSGYLNLWKENKAAAIGLTSALAALVALYSKNLLQKAKDNIFSLKLLKTAKDKLGIDKLQNLIQSKRILNTEKQRLAEMQLELQQVNLISTNRTLLMTTQGYNRVMEARIRETQLLSAIQAQQTVVTNASTAAVKAQNIAMSSTPWGAVLLAVTALTSGIIALAKSHGKYKKEVEALNKQIGDETSRANYLFDKLDKLDKKTTEYKDTLSQLNDLYPDIIRHYIDEEGHLGNLAVARQAVIDKIKQQVMEQRRLDKYGEIAGTFEASKNDALARIHDYLVKHNGKAGESQYRSLLSSLPSTFDKEFSFQSAYSKVKESTGIDLGDVFGWNKLSRAVGDYVNALNEAFAEQKKWESVFGDNSNYEPTWSTLHYKDKGIPLAQKETDSPSSAPETKIDKAAQRAAEREAKKAAEELEKARKESLERVEKILSDYAKRGTIETVNTALQQKDQEITDAAKALMDANSSTNADGTLTWASDEAYDMYVNLVKSRDEIKKGVINDWLMKLSEDTRDLAQRLNDLSMVNISDIEKIDPQAAQDFRDLIVFYQNLAQSASNAADAVTNVADGVSKTKPIDDWIKALDTFASKALDTFSSIGDIISNSEDRQLQKSKQYHEQKVEALDNELQQGIISQEIYNARKNALDKDLEEEEKQIQLSQFNRQKALSIAEATIAGTLAALRVLSDPTYQGNSKWVEFALVTAAAAANIAAIASQPAPYAKGGYTKEPTILVGERGQEWVASNRLLRDPVTAPIISSLESYQRGNSSALDSIAMQSVNLSAVASAADYRRQQAANDAAMLTELRLLRRYLSDPRNRQAVISRATQEAFDSNENFLRNARKI